MTEYLGGTFLEHLHSLHLLHTCVSFTFISRSGEARLSPRLKSPSESPFLAVAKPGRLTRLVAGFFVDPYSPVGGKQFGGGQASISVSATPWACTRRGTCSQLVRSCHSVSLERLGPKEKSNSSPKHFTAVGQGYLDGIARPEDGGPVVLPARRLSAGITVSGDESPGPIPILSTASEFLAMGAKCALLWAVLLSS